MEGPENAVLTIFSSSIKVLQFSRRPPYGKYVPGNIFRELLTIDKHNKKNQSISLQINFQITGIFSFTNSPKYRTSSPKI